MLTENKTCMNCKYFLRQYVNVKGKLIHTYYGHCANPNVNYRKNKNCINDNLSCEHWENRETNKRDTLERIDAVLRKTAKTVNEIAQILKHEI